MTAPRDRFDLLFVPTDGGHVLPDAAARSLLRQLATLQLAVPFDEAVAATWVEVYLQPGPAAHLLFVEGPAPDVGPPFLEGVFRFSETRTEPPFGDAPPCAVSLELRGAAFPDVLGTFRQRIAEVLGMRVALHRRSHEALPPHRVVPDSEKRVVPEKAPSPGSTRGAVGVRIEEF
jgi:hypothetical protein